MVNYKNFLKNIFSLQEQKVDEHNEDQADRVVISISPEELSPLVLAYIGDGVYELFVRTHFLAMGRINSRTLHQNTIKFVAARSQARILRRLDDFLTDSEKIIVKRGRNKKTFHVPKSANVGEYH
ncbi:MAG: hypothetical protein N3E37_05455, partial [Candidatus Micrarchaeota archaeon]|nr:hypothetical protein [Candidatus Micrarchaeota archaeon]